MLQSRKSILLLLACPYLCGQPGVPLLSWGFGCWQPKPTRAVEKWVWGRGKVGLGSVSDDFRAANALFILLGRLKSTLRTCHAAGRLQTNVFHSSCRVWVVRCPKKGQLHLPQPASSSLHGDGEEHLGIPALTPNTGDLPWSFQRGRLRSLRFYGPSNN